MPGGAQSIIVCNKRGEAWSTDDLLADEIKWEFADCPFEVRERSPCDPLYRLVSVEEAEDGIVTMVLELVEDEPSVIGMGKDAWARLRQRKAEMNDA